MPPSLSCCPEQGALVLIVEDEALQRISLMDLVEEAGYRVLEAADADQAMDVLERRSDIRIVMADVDMPGTMDGLGLVGIVRARWPSIDIIVTSGRGIPHSGTIPPRATFLPKPLNEHRVRGALEAFA
ncbi:response regulator [Swaminathania salitolerans]|uniref:Response regulator n=1 Tax=Swaminathania salitolerans TaxID=182838 RepID=A0A511BPM6_9PROT|nr:response regulator [Swaminathania salitolerans]GBQ11009.1 chemotaxis protein CheY [Swaminathania salitolerans LMG 21291]GEL02267.1 response regulator [Swaminathania salitolerans]